jgi:hypothetical protein
MMESVSPELQIQILDAVKTWAAPRYGDDILTASMEHATIQGPSSEGEADYMVLLNLVDRPEPMRFKVFVAPDGGLHISD